MTQNDAKMRQKVRGPPISVTYDANTLTFSKKKKFFIKIDLTKNKKKYFLARFCSTSNTRKGSTLLLPYIVRHFLYICVMEEIIKPLSLHPDSYLISNLGYLYNRKKNCIISGSLSNVDGQTISFKIKGKTYTLRNLVAMDFLDYRPNGLKELVYHIDGDRSNCRADNLVIDRNRYSGHYNGKDAFCTSDHRGVSWSVRKNKFRAIVSHRGRRYDLGYYDTEGEAKDAADRKRKKLGIFVEN